MSCCGGNCGCGSGCQCGGGCGGYKTFVLAAPSNKASSGGMEMAVESGENGGCGCNTCKCGTSCSGCSCCSCN
ncbi:hypothetical protein DAI22_05g009300 [Oryza sativa Japonica Group]|nr:hypothetical protein DAI22_05g009300 [Oryza sativa Japonica Group]